MALTPIFDIAVRALAVQDRVLHTTGHNIANVDRPGYSRQEVEVLAGRPQLLDTFILGSGVRAETVQQIVDPLLERQLQQARSGSAEASASRDELVRLEALFDELDGRGMRNALDRFFAAVDEVAQFPQGIAQRTVLLAEAESLATVVRQRVADITQLQRDADDRIGAAIPRANALLDEIAELNTRILGLETQGQTANDSRDQRRVALGELGELIGITYFETDGGLSVFGPNGTPLVERNMANHLVADKSTAPVATGLDSLPLTTLGVQLPTGGFLPFSGQISGGELGGILAFRDVDVLATAASLDQFADALRTAVNSVHAAGEDLDGNAGGALFGGTSASDLTVSITDPRLIAASAAVAPAPNTPEDNQNAHALVALASTVLDGTDATLGNADLGGATFTGFLSSLVGSVGALGESAATRAEATEALTTTLASQRAALSGVDTNEELLKLMSAQRAYQAAARLVTVATNTLDAVLDMVR